MAHLVRYHERQVFVGLDVGAHQVDVAFVEHAACSAWHRYAGRVGQRLGGLETKDRTTCVALSRLYTTGKRRFIDDALFSFAGLRCAGAKVERSASKTVYGNHCACRDLTTTFIGHQVVFRVRLGGSGQRGQLSPVASQTDAIQGRSQHRLQFALLAFHLDQRVELWCAWVRHVVGPVRCLIAAVAGCYLFRGIGVDRGFLRSVY